MNHEAWKTLLAAESLPCAIVDLDAVDHNLALLRAARAREDVTLRVATKSVRVPAVLRHLREHGGSALRGWMPWSAGETRALFEQGFDDFLMGYPVARPQEADTLAALAADGAQVIACVDDAHHVAVLAEAARAHGTEVPVCIDVDLSLRPAAGVHLGVRRSPHRDAVSVVALARRIAEAEGVRLAAVLAYEAQVAGLADRAPGTALKRPVLRWLKARSVALARERRSAVLEALEREGHAIAVVNGGGTGSLRTTSAEAAVTEVTVGSGFLCPHLFDHYDGLPLRPAAFFALPICRRSDPDHVTCLTGGFIASGAPGPDRLPQVHSPPGLTPVALEGWGEVQTPFRCGRDAPQLRLGDPVIARHAKAGELFEHFREVLLVRGGAVVDRVPTLRGTGWGYGG